MDGYRGKRQPENRQWRTLVRRSLSDAASYWFDANLGRTLWKRKDVNASIRVQALAGFYCWMTNDVVNRQNDAFCYGAGVLGTYRGFSLDCNYAGFRGYRDNGDKPMILGQS